MKKILLLMLVLSACTNEKEASRVLQLDGFTNPTFTGYKWFDCSTGDFYHTGFSATKNGQQVSGVVCSGLLFKSSTIRF